MPAGCVSAAARARAGPPWLRVETGTTLTPPLPRPPLCPAAAQVIAGACRCLCTMAQSDSIAAVRLVDTVRVYQRFAHGREADKPHFLARFLFILGKLCRWARV